MALVECKECGQEISTKAKTCPNCGASTKDFPFWIGLVLLIIIVSFGYSLIQPSQSEGTDDWKRTTDEIGAYVAAQRFVEEKLKSPGTARFPALSQLSDEDVQRVSGQRYSVNAYVDSENSFGAEVRTNFKLELRRTGKTNWQLSSINIEE